MSDTQLPPVGSLWLHRETGERRFFLILEYSWIAKDFRVEFVGVIEDACHFKRCSIADWLAWAAGAERIDKEQL